MTPLDHPAEIAGGKLVAELIVYRTGKAATLDAAVGRVVTKLLGKRLDGFRECQYPLLGNEVPCVLAHEAIADLLGIDFVLNLLDFRDDVEGLVESVVAGHSRTLSAVAA